MLSQIRDEINQLPRPHPVVIGFLLAFLGLLLFAYWKVISNFWLPKWSDPNGYYSHAYLVPLLALVILWLRRETLLKMQAQPSWWGVPVLLLAMGARVVGHWQMSHWLPSAVFPLFLIGASLLVLGKPITRVLLYPILFLYFLIPLPSYVFDEITHPIQVWSTDVSLLMLNTLGYKTVRMSEISFLMPSMYELGVGVECSGFKLTISLLTFVFFFLNFVNLPLWKKTILVLVVLPLAVFINALRITSIAMIGEQWGPQAGSVAHDWSGYIVLLVAFALFFGLARWLGWKR